MRERKSYILLLLFLLTNSLSHAEVMDKEPSLTTIWLIGVVGSVICFFASRFKPKALFITVPLSLLIFWAAFWEIQDPFVGQAIKEEAGTFYVSSVYILPFIIVVSSILGIVIRKFYPNR